MRFLKRCVSLVLAMVFSLSMAGISTAFAAHQFPSEAIFDIDLSGTVLGNDYCGAVLDVSADEVAITYGTEYQYGDVFFKIPVELPEGALLSDYQTLSYDIWSNGSYAFKAQAVLAEDYAYDLPSSIDLDWGSARASNAINIANTAFYTAPNDTWVTETLSITRVNAALLGTNRIWITVYIHMEFGAGGAEVKYAIKNAQLVRADTPLDNEAITVADGTNGVFGLNWSTWQQEYIPSDNKGIMVNTDDDSVTVHLSRAMKGGEKLVLEAYNAEDELLGSCSRIDTDRGIVTFGDDEVDTYTADKFVAYVVDTADEDALLSNQYELVNTAYKSVLESLLANTKRYYPGDYTNGGALTAAIASAQAQYDSEASRNSDYGREIMALRAVLETLDPVNPFENTFSAPEDLTVSYAVPDVLTMLDGTKVTTKEQWVQRDKEIREMLQYYAYGIYRDGTGEELSAIPSGSTIDISVSRPGLVSTATYTAPGTASFSASVTVPSGEAPEGGWPVIIGLGSVGQGAYALSQGYATISFDPTAVAADSTSRSGAFYDLYPYLDVWTQQTGALMAWSWGVSKIIDALQLENIEAEYNLSKTEIGVNGVSRYGKGAAIATAYDKRVKLGLPTCSGYPGLTTLRYSSDQKTFFMEPWFDADYPEAGSFSVGGDGSLFWKSTGGNEPMSSHANNGWLNDIYRRINTLYPGQHYNMLPFDQHFLASLCALDENDDVGNRYLMMIIGVVSDDWSSPPGMWYTYENTRPVYELLGMADYLAINIHPDLHGNEQEDMEKAFAWFEHLEHGTEIDESALSSYIQGTLRRTGLTLLESLKTCVYASDANKAVYDESKPKARITFNANGGSVDTAYASANADGRLASLPVPTWMDDSHTFKGWFTTATSQVEITTDTVFAADTTIYAQWAERTPEEPGIPDNGGGTFIPPVSTIPGNMGDVAIPMTVNSGGKVVANLNNDTLDKLISNAISAKDGVATLDVSGIKDATAVEFSVKAAMAFSEVDISVVVKLPNGEVALDPDALTELIAASNADTTAITIEVKTVQAQDLTGMQAAQVKGYDTVINIDLFVGSTKVNAPLTISLPYTLKPNEDPNAVCVWHLDENGNLTQLNGVYDAKTGMIAFSANHQSYFVAGYDPVALWVNRFSDVAKDSWIYSGIAYSSYYGYVEGIGNGKFDPNGIMTRAMFATLLWNLGGQPAPAVQSGLSDVAEGWYKKAAYWVVENEIVNVSGGVFDPNTAITREDMAVMMHNYANAKGYTIPQNRDMPAFTDAAKISESAMSAVRALSEAGVINGSTTHEFLPSKTFTRAEVAAMFKNFLRLVVEE